MLNAMYEMYVNIILLRLPVHTVQCAKIMKTRKIDQKQKHMRGLILLKLKQMCIVYKKNNKIIKILMLDFNE
jgi:hypothetical protein